MFKKKVYFVALTTYQVFVSDLYARYIKERYEDFDIYIFIIGVNMGYIKTEDVYKVVTIPEMNIDKVHRIWQRLYWAGVFFRFSPLSKYFDKNFEICLFLFNDNEPITNKILRFVKKSEKSAATIIEEGIGIYETSTGKRTLKQNIRYLITSLMGSPMQYKSVGDNRNIDNVIVGDVRLYKTLKKSEGKEIIFQDKKNIYKHSADFLKRNSIVLPDLAKYRILYLGQPFDEYGELIECEEKFIIKLLEKLPDNAVIIKPHPRDKFGKYDVLKIANQNIAVLDGEMAKLPLECILSCFDIRVIISLNSSAGVNIANSNKDIFCIFTFNLKEADLVKKQWGNNYTEMNRNVFRSKYRNIFVPKEYDEYLQDIENALRKNSNCHENGGEGEVGYNEVDRVIQKFEVIYSKEGIGK